MVYVTFREGWCHSSVSSFSAEKEYFLSYKTTLGLFFPLKLHTAPKDLAQLVKKEKKKWFYFIYSLKGWSSFLSLHLLPSFNHFILSICWKALSVTLKKLRYYNFASRELLIKLVRRNKVKITARETIQLIFEITSHLPLNVIHTLSKNDTTLLPQMLSWSAVIFSYLYFN